MKREGANDEVIVENIMSQIGVARLQYYRLILVVGPPGAGKSNILRELAVRTGAPLLNVGLELSRRLLDYPPGKRPYKVERELQVIVQAANNDVVLLDNTEVLFDASLKLNPLKVLQRISRNTTVVAAWSGSVVEEHLTYAAPGHEEYRSYPATEAIVFPLGG